MLRSGALKSLQPAWRSSLISMRHQSSSSGAAAVAAAEPEQPAEEQPQQERQQRVPLSARLGGSGRGKTLEAADPFAAFLQAAQQKNRRMNQRGNKSNASAPGQFDDAEEKRPQHQRPRRNNNRPQMDADGQQQQRADGQKFQRNNGQQRQRDNGQQRQRDNGQQRQKDGQRQQRANGLQHQKDGQRQQRQSKAPRKPSESRRVTTFIDKDIDWTAISGFDDQEIEVTANMVAGSTEEPTSDNRDKMLAELQTGDYERYFHVANGLTFGPTVSTDALNSLVGGNASYGFDQKMSFLSAVSKATGGTAAASK